ncbi:NAD(P)/FAD-dependent oxidoreductase [Pseudonocardia xishanensis]|uniref:FAD-dependent oxidoreductase n=1 Tax=Pseudonocardia xishanensis TaxID=630995 RepID=A0ABP8RQ84_9PSEU
MRDGIVVVGAGHAGVQAADALRERGYSGPVTLVSGEPELPYTRPPVSKDLLYGDAEPEPLRPASFYRERRISLVPAAARGIDRDARLVHVSGGIVARYDHLVLATGARARRPDQPGSDLRGVLTLRTAADARMLRGYLRPGARVVVLGGGFIGLEVAAAARAQGAEVTLIERGDRVLGRGVSATTAAMVTEHHREAGVRLVLGEQVACFVSEGGGVTGVRTGAGGLVAADVVVAGIGAVPDDGLARAARLPVRNGIVVDQWLTTADPRISAIGDCAAVREPLTGAITRLESVQNASDQARYIADLLTGGTSRPYRALPWFWSDQGSLRLQMVLRSPAHDRTVSVRNGARTSVLRFDGGLLTGVESINDPSTHQAARRLLDRAAPTEAELAEVDHDVRALARQVRQEKVGA